MLDMLGELVVLELVRGPGIDGIMSSVRRMAVRREEAHGESTGEGSV